MHRNIFYVFLLSHRSLARCAVLMAYPGVKLAGAWSWPLPICFRG